jgi:hypothetical protein
LRHIPLRRRHFLIARVVRERLQGRRVSLRQERVGFSEGCWDARHPLEAGISTFLEIVLALEGTIGHEIRYPGGGTSLGNVVLNGAAKRLGIMTLATERFHQERNPGLMFHYQLQHNVVEVGTMRTTGSGGASSPSGGTTTSVASSPLL